MPTELAHERRVRIFEIISAVLGLWLMVAPTVIGAPGQRVARVGLAVGALIVILAVIRYLFKHTVVISFAIALLGAWTIMSPWVLEQTSADYRTWNYILVGILVAAVETYSLTSSTTQPNWRQNQTGRR
jgi:SPW repeat